VLRRWSLIREASAISKSAAQQKLKSETYYKSSHLQDFVVAYYEYGNFLGKHLSSIS